MSADAFLQSLLAAESASEILQAVSDFCESTSGAQWVPVGGRPNNRGIIEVSSNPGRALVERVTNAVDAVLDAEYVAHDGRPVVRSPREAAMAWLNVPDSGLSGMSASARRTLSKRVIVRMRPGDGVGKRVIDVLDQGVGLDAAQMPTTILSLNESNKVLKPHQAGTYGQGGSATFAAAEVSVIVSRKVGAPRVAFTVVRFEPPPPSQFKGGSYVFLTLNGEVPTAENSEFDSGTLCSHFGYDLTRFSSAIGPNSVYGMLQQVLFDPVLPIWFENRIHDWNRVIKGSRNGLNGASDEGDEPSSKLSHRMPMFFASLGDFGRLGIEYWVLDRGDKKNKRPSSAYVDPNKPIILTLNGQNQAELGVKLVRKDAELPYLAQRLICHVDCNSLSTDALRSLFSSNREEARAGSVYALIEQELVAALKSDDDLARLNSEARDKRYDEEDEAASKSMRTEVAKLLRLQGFEVSTDLGLTRGPDGDGDRPPGGRGRGRRAPVAIQLQEPPTYIKIMWPADEAIALHPSQRKYIRVETDANSKYHDPTDPAGSAVNVAVLGKGIRQAGTTALSGGRMRVLITCDEGAKAGADGSITVELKVAGRPTLSDRRSISVTDPPPARKSTQRMVLPTFDVRPVDGPDHEMWSTLDWPEDVKSVASSVVHEPGQLVVYYSRVYPRFADFFMQLKGKDAAAAASFENRYKIWLAVHSLLLDREDQETATARTSHSDGSEGEYSASMHERRERCRVATLAAMMAMREVDRSSSGSLEE